MLCIEANIYARQRKRLVIEQDGAYLEHTIGLITMPAQGQPCNTISW
jgi:hypothetical protein